MRERENICKYLTLYSVHKAQTLIKVRADAMQTQAKLGVTVVLARPTSVVAHVELVAALRHSGDPQVQLSNERTCRNSSLKQQQLLWLLLAILCGRIGRVHPKT